MGCLPWHYSEPCGWLIVRMIRLGTPPNRIIPVDFTDYIYKIYGLADETLRGVFRDLRMVDLADEILRRDYMGSVTGSAEYCG